MSIVVEPMKPAWYKLHEHFGDEYFHSDGTLNREKLGQLVFSDSEQRKIVDSATHPEIQKSIVWQLIRCLLRGTVASSVITSLIDSSCTVSLSIFVIFCLAEQLRVLILAFV